MGITPHGSVVINGACESYGLNFEVAVEVELVPYTPYYLLHKINSLIHRPDILYGKRVKGYTFLTNQATNINMIVAQ